ncbi:MAG: hypothetical protein GYA51_03260 [Candidatus Methanofastidiosa archaeon]|nr:hypothetical protein [Candidatus Methanofastidiosa archaeon]
MEASGKINLENKIKSEGITQKLKSIGYSVSKNTDSTITIEKRAQKGKIELKGDKLHYQVSFDSVYVIAWAIMLPIIVFLVSYAIFRYGTIPPSFFYFLITIAMLSSISVYEVFTNNVHFNMAKITGTQFKYSWRNAIGFNLMLVSWTIYLLAGYIVTRNTSSLVYFVISSLVLLAVFLRESKFKTKEPLIDDKNMLKIRRGIFFISSFCFLIYSFFYLLFVENGTIGLYIMLNAAVIGILYLFFYVKEFGNVGIKKSFIYTLIIVGAMIIGLIISAFEMSLR